MTRDCPVQTGAGGCPGYGSEQQAVLVPWSHGVDFQGYFMVGNSRHPLFQRMDPAPSHSAVRLTRGGKIKGKGGKAGAKALGASNVLSPHSQARRSASLLPSLAS